MITRLVQSLRHVWLFANPWTTACQASLSFTISQSLFTLMSIESVMSSNHLILCHPLLSLPSIFPSIVVCSMSFLSWLFASGGQSIGVSALVSVLPMNIQDWFPLGLISCKTDWLYLLSVQGTLKNLLQHHNLKHQFFGAQPSLQVILHLHSYKYSRKKLISINKRW